MAVPVKISIEQLAETLNGLSVSEREELKPLLDSQWYETEDMNFIINGLLDKSSEQYRQGKFRSSEEIIRESKDKYGL